MCGPGVRASDPHSPLSTRSHACFPGGETQRLREVEAPASGHAADGRSRAWSSSCAPHFLVPRLQPSRSQTPIWLERCFVWPTLLLKEKKDDIGHQHLNGQIYIQIWISGWQFGGCAWQPPAWGCPVQAAVLVIRPFFRTTLSSCEAAGRRLGFSRCRSPYL